MREVAASLCGEPQYARHPTLPRPFGQVPLFPSVTVGANEAQRGEGTSPRSPVRSLGSDGHRTGFWAGWPQALSSQHLTALSLGTHAAAALCGLAF